MSEDGSELLTPKQRAAKEIYEIAAAANAGAHLEMPDLYMRRGTWQHSARMDSVERAVQQRTEAYDLGTCTWEHFLYEALTKVLAEANEDERRKLLVELGSVVVLNIEAIDRRKERREAGLRCPACGAWRQNTHPIVNGEIEHCDDPFHTCREPFHNVSDYRHNDNEQTCPTCRKQYEQ